MQAQGVEVGRDVSVHLTWTSSSWKTTAWRWNENQHPHYNPHQIIENGMPSYFWHVHPHPSVWTFPCVISAFVTLSSLHGTRSWSREPCRCCIRVSLHLVHSRLGFTQKQLIDFHHLLTDHPMLCPVRAEHRAVVKVRAVLFFNDAFSGIIFNGDRVKTGNQPSLI